MAYASLQRTRARVKAMVDGIMAFGVHVPKVPAGPRAPDPPPDPVATLDPRAPRPKRR